MKKIGIGIAVVIISQLFFMNISFAQKAEKVYSIVKQKKSHEWFVQQAGLWWAEIEKDKNNPDAWYNYYLANRMARLTVSSSKRKNDVWCKESKFLKPLDKIVADIQKNIPNTYESFYLKWYNNNNIAENSADLLKAYEINSNRPEVYSGLITHYELERDLKKRKEYCKLWFNTNDISADILAWNYNILMSTEKNAILFTNGDNGTYPLWILQDAKNVRTDVTVINLAFLDVKEYRDKIFNKLSIKPLEDYTQNDVMKHIIDNATNNPVYFSMSMGAHVLDNFDENLYLTGLTFKYSKEKFDNIAVLKRNYEQYFLLDYLKINLRANDISAGVVKQANSNYIMPFIKLYNHYKLSGEQGKAEEVKQLGMKIAKANGKAWEQKASAYFN